MGAKNQIPPVEPSLWLFLFCCCYFVYTLPAAEHQVQGLEIARQVLYHLALLVCFSFYAAGPGGHVIRTWGRSKYGYCDLSSLSPKQVFAAPFPET